MPSPVRAVYPTAVAILLVALASPAAAARRALVVEDPIGGSSIATADNIETYLLGRAWTVSRATAPRRPRFALASPSPAATFIVSHNRRPQPNRG